MLSLSRLGTVEGLDSLSSAPPTRNPRLPKTSSFHLLTHPVLSSLPEGTKPLLKVFCKQLEAARLARSEPTGGEFEGCMKVVALLLGM